MDFLISYVQPWGTHLLEKYPLIFMEGAERWKTEYKTDLPTEEFCNLRLGFECDQGWSEIIEHIAQVATEVVTDLRKIHPDVYIHSCIIKEKFGTLRWQGEHNLPEPYNEIWRSFLKDMEDKSSRTCEVTGNWGELRTTRSGRRAWHKTLCKEEALKRGYDIEEQPPSN